MDQAYTNFAIFLDGVEYLGMASVTLPNLTALTQTISGAGLSGNVEAVIQGHFDAMSMTLNFQTTTKDSIKISAPSAHTIELRADQQYYDAITSTIKHRKEKHVLTIMPKAHSIGTIAPASPSNGSGEFAVYRWVTYLDGKRIRNIDPINYKCEIDGVDYLSVERKNLGK